MYRKLLFLIASLLVLLLAACGGASVDAPVADQAPAVEVTNLADDVDVHTVASVKDQPDVESFDRNTD